MPAGRPTVRMACQALEQAGEELFGPETGTQKAHAVQQHLRPHRRRNVALARHLPRFVPNDFKMKSLYGQSETSFVDWPIGYEDLVDWYGKAEAEFGVSADLEDQKYLGIYFPDGYQYPMPGIPNSLTDRAIRSAHEP